MRWTLLIDPEGRPGRENMWIDDTLLRRARDGAAWLRVYRWAPGCLSFGRHEPARRRYDSDRIAGLGLDTVRRPTGGRAVWHDREVTYAVAGPVALFGSLRETYHAIHQMLASALRRLGVATTLAGVPDRASSLAAGACFATAAGGEVLAAGGKVVGSAQVREQDRFLQHGSILLADDQEIVTRVSRVPASPPAAAPLGAILGRHVTFDEVADAIARTAAATWPGTWRRATSPVRPPETPNRFADPTWTWRR